MKKQTEKHIKEIDDSFEEKNTQYQLSTQQLQSQLEELNGQLQEEQKKNEQVISDLKKEISQKELLWKKQTKQKDLIILITFLPSFSLSIWVLWN